MLQKMRQKDIDDFFRVLDDAIKQMGEPGGYDAAVKTIEAARRHPRPETAIPFKLGTAIAEMVAQVEGRRVDEILKLGRLPTRADLEQQLAQTPELTDEDRAMIDRLKNMPISIRRSAEAAAKVIVPNGGHPVLNPAVRIFKDL